MRTESWCGHEIRFVEVNGEWYAILKDICDALGLRSKDISQILDPDMLERVCVETSEDGSNGLRSRGDNKTRWMLAIHEIDIYKALFASGQLEARKFRRWSATVLQKLRNQVGLEQYEVMRMTEPETPFSKLVEDCFDKIEKADLVLVVPRDDGSIGKGTTYEIVFARRVGTDVIFLNI